MWSYDDSVGDVALPWLPGGEPEMSEQQAIRMVVERRVDSLDDFFVAVLRVCGGAARQDGNVDLAGALLLSSLMEITQLSAYLHPYDVTLDNKQYFSRCWLLFHSSGCTLSRNVRRGLYTTLESHWGRGCSSSASKCRAFVQKPCTASMLALNLH